MSISIGEVRWEQRLFFSTESMPLKENEKLSSISKEFHTRKHIVYIAEDTLHEFVILSQRLSGLAKQINEIVGDTPDQVSVPGLYKIVSSPCENKLIKHQVENLSTIPHRWCSGCKRVRDC